MPQVRHHYRAARRLRPRPHHRRLPPRRALRRGPSDRGQAGRARTARRHVADRRSDPQAARNWQTSCARWKTWSRWPSSTAATFRGQPATDARSRAVDLSGYLGAIKEANGAAMSIGRISTFLDIYIERDLHEGRLDEAGAQELIDQLVQKAAHRALSCARRNTTHCSAAIRTGRPNASAAWTWTAGRW